MKDTGLKVITFVQGCVEVVKLGNAHMNMCGEGEYKDEGRIKSKKF